jgi:threonine synthase
MFAKVLRCVVCGKEHKLEAIYTCQACGGILDVRYDEKRIAGIGVSTLFPPPAPGLWRYKYLLPVAREDAMLSLAEGGTPLLDSPTLAEMLQLDHLFLKDETRNPSGAFKDRPMAVGVSKAVELGFSSVVTASSGNAAASLAVYAAKARLRCIVFVPERTPIGKVAHAVICGAKVIKVKGDYSNSYRLAMDLATGPSMMNLTTTFINPFTVEGDKTAAYEIYSQLGEIAPDWVIIPTGAGPLLYGIYKGFQEIRRLGLISKIPRLVAVQAAGCSPIVSAFRSRQSVKPWGAVRTTASAIADPLRGYEKDGDLLLSAVYSSQGFAVAVDDEEILNAVRTLGTREGVFAEPGGAASVAAVKKLVAAGAIGRSDKVVCLITGHGLKDPSAAVPKGQVTTVEPDIDEVKKMLGG